MSTIHNINIKHACNGGEQIIKVGQKNFKVDGIFENTVLQFHGCFIMDVINVITKILLITKDKDVRKIYMK